MEALDCVRVVDDDDIRILRKESLQLIDPFRVGDFVYEAIEGALIDQGFREFDREKVDSTFLGEIDEGRLNEALNFLLCERVPYAVPSSFLGHGS